MGEGPRRQEVVSLESKVERVLQSLSPLLEAHEKIQSRVLSLSMSHSEAQLLMLQRFDAVDARLMQVNELVGRLQDNGTQNYAARHRTFAARGRSTNIAEPTKYTPTLDLHPSGLSDTLCNMRREQLEASAPLQKPMAESSYTIAGRRIPSYLTQSLEVELHMLEHPHDAGGLADEHER